MQRKIEGFGQGGEMGISGRKTKANVTGELTSPPMRSTTSWVRTSARHPAVSQVLGLSLPLSTNLSPKAKKTRRKERLPPSLKAAHVQTTGQPAPSSDFVSTHSQKFTVSS